LSLISKDQDLTFKSNSLEGPSSPVLVKTLTSISLAVVGIEPFGIEMPTGAFWLYLKGSKETRLIGTHNGCAKHSQLYSMQLYWSFQQIAKSQRRPLALCDLLKSPIQSR
jgi:hypothetical protein